MQRPRDDEYYAKPDTATIAPGDLFERVPMAVPAPPDALIVAENGQRFVSGPFEITQAILVTPAFALVSTPARTLVPIRRIADLRAAGALNDEDVDELRRDQLRGYLFLPAGGPIAAESAALLFMPLTVTDEVIAGNRIARLTTAGQQHLRRKLVSYDAGIVVPTELLAAGPD